ncbi:hypothetical protein RRF57_003753 [Xylaria bambusicola]|uniref:Uncharacterized protein n=1 Tax=Xylaria bambusicola TaxID=326684 RepID=A0AAN7UV07_9PEZI
MSVTASTNKSDFTLPYRKAKNRMDMMTARTLMVQCSAFLKTLYRQYMKAAIHKNHSRTAASMITPTIAV